MYIYSGAGPIGLVSLLAARAAGAAPIIITDIAQSRLDFAKTLVPGVKTILVERGVEPKDVAAKIKAEAGLPLGMSVALECTGVESSVQTAIFAAKFGSTVFVRHFSLVEILTPADLDFTWEGNRRRQGLPVASVYAHVSERD